MSDLYLDASVLVALLTNDPLTDRADAALRRNPATLVVSDFAGAEFASALARRVRTGELRAEEARAAFATFDAWTARTARRIETIGADVTASEAYLRRLDLTLRTPDALNIAIAERVGASLMTFDVKMAAVARNLGMRVTAG